MIIAPSTAETIAPIASSGNFLVADKIVPIFLYTSDIRNIKIIMKREEYDNLKYTADKNKSTFIKILRKIT